MIKLEEWSVVGHDPYLPPEAQVKCLIGTVYNHPQHKDGKRIRTSRIHNVTGRLVQTNNTLYKLGKPHKEYIEWCQNNNTYIPTEEEPIKWKSI